MPKAIQSSTSSLAALADSYRAIAHNLANASTPGYKARRSAFASAMAGAEGAGGAGPAVSARLGIDFSQGAIAQTGRSLDLAIDGEGFFVLETPQGVRYTRNGTFRANAQGQLVDHAGRMVAGEGGPIVIPAVVSPEAVQVGADGTVVAAGNSIGKLRIVRFDDPSRLRPLDGTCFEAPRNMAPQPAPSASVHRGAQESSNVNVVQELVGLISVTRLYEANIKSLNVQDERMKNILHVAMA